MNLSDPRCGTISDGKYRLDGDAWPAALAALGAQLGQAGVGAGLPVALVVSNTLPSVLTLLALLQRGASVVLVPPAARAEAELPLPRFVALRLAPQAPASPAGSDASGAGDASDPARPWSPPANLDWLGLTQLSPTAVLAEDCPLRQGHLFLRTSGSLGAPKWVQHSHARLLDNARAAADRLALQATDRVLIPVPLAHMYGLGAGFLPALLVGASIELLSGANLLRYLDCERRFRPTLSFLTPSLGATLLRPRAGTHGYRAVVMAGDRLSPELQAQAQACYGRVINLYGSTEMGVICAEEARLPPGPPGRVGPPLVGVTLQIAPPPPADGAQSAESAAPPSLSPAAADQCTTGEILCAHPYGFVGYVDDDGKPTGGAQTGWYATRDLGCRYDDGSLEVLGRLDHATKRDGRLVMLAEVERALCQLPEVERAAVVLGAPTLRGRALLAFVSGRAEHHLSADELVRLCQQRLPSFAVPDQLRVLPALPLLPSGKLDRQALLRLASSP